MENISITKEIYYGICFTFNKKSLDYKKNIKLYFEKNKYVNSIDYYFYDNDKQISFNKKMLNVFVDSINSKMIIKVDNKKYISFKKLLNDYFVVPNLFNIQPNFIDYKKKMVRLEHVRDLEKNKIFNKYNKIFNKTFNVLNGIDDIYDWYTGAIYFKNYEWEEIENNSIKKIFDSCENESYIYSLPLDNGIILRGANIYYYLLTYVSRFEKTTFDDINNWYKNCKIFIQVTLDALKNYKINSTYDIRLILALIDNARNIILLMLNCELLLNNMESDFIYHYKKQNDHIGEYMYLVELYQDLIKYYCFTRPINDNYTTKVIELFKRLKIIFTKTFNEIIRENSQYILDKGFNRLREIDHYFENFITCEYGIKNAIKTLTRHEKEINLITILYGGLELPSIIKYNNFTNKEVNISYLYQNNGDYFKKQLSKEQSSMPKKLFEIGKINKLLPTFLIDDNLMSGVTMQFAFNQLIVNNYSNIICLLAVRHPNINRISQIKHYGNALNLDLIDKFIYGLLTDTSYTKIKDNTNNDNRFVNELNIYSIQSEIFLKALYINNSFTGDSEVDIFNGFSQGKV